MYRIKTIFVYLKCVILFVATAHMRSSYNARLCVSKSVHLACEDIWGIKVLIDFLSYH